LVRFIKSGWYSSKKLSSSAGLSKIKKPPANEAGGERRN
jgi:hypothetical protein